MPLRYTILQAELRRFRNNYGRGAWAELSRRSGLSDAAISIIAAGKVKPKLSTWEALYAACPDDFSPPQFGPVSEDLSYTEIDYDSDGPAPFDMSYNSAIEIAIEGLNAIPGVEMCAVPLFDAGAGEPSSFTDGGYPVGEAGEFITVPKEGLDDNTFAVRIHGDSMTPYLEEGDIAVVVPSAPLQNGKLCFATWPGDDGDKLIKRYYKYGDVIVLKSDNPQYPDIEINGGNHEGVRIYRVKKTIREE